MNRPNILHIHSDQHSPFVTGSYGDPLVRTPHLDTLSAQGVTFDNAYCVSPICGPSRMAMLTGCYPYQTDFWCNDQIYNSGLPTWANALGAVGYNPVLIGRLHSIGPDQLRGFTNRKVGDHRPNFMGGRPVDHGEFEGTQDPTRVSLQKSGCGQNAYQVHDEYVVAESVDFLNKVGIDRKCGTINEPFCLSVGLMLPHQPYLAQEADYAIYEDIMFPPKKQSSYTDDLHPYFQQWRQKTGIQTVSEEETMRARIAYWGLVTRLDHMIGQILRALKDNGLDENTFIIYTSDHGEHVGEHGLWWKHTFYEESVRIPLIMSWPGVLPLGTRSDKVVNALDVTATLLEAAGAPALPRSAGRSMLSLMKDEEAVDWENQTFAEYCTYDGTYNRMIRSGKWKLNYYHGMEPQLFHLEDDPEELVDLAQDASYQTIRNELVEQVLKDWEPKVIADKLALIRRENDILADWAGHVKPEDTHRWELKKDMHYLKN